eukprot:2223936-Alexandrium_andersonii.AAC.1
MDDVAPQSKIALQVPLSEVVRYTNCCDTHMHSDSLYWPPSLAGARHSRAMCPKRPHRKHCMLARDLPLPFEGG